MRQKWNSQLVQIRWKGGFEKAKLCGSVYTHKKGGGGVKSTHFIKCVERVFSSDFFVCIGNVKVYGNVLKRYNFHRYIPIDKVLSNFAGRAGYATFPARRHPAYCIAWVCYGQLCTL